MVVPQCRWQYAIGVGASFQKKYSLQKYAIGVLRKVVQEYH
jgi:hypothetical protein